MFLAKNIPYKFSLEDIKVKGGGGNMLQSLIIVNLVLTVALEKQA